MMMLDYLANNNYLVTGKEGVDKFMASKEQKYVNLKKHIPVHVGYLLRMLIAMALFNTIQTFMVLMT